MVPDDAILVTVDVTNLYPSIPQSECLNIIHTEMHKHSHLFTFDPNFITRLLHININYNYFKFGNHTSAFSPTIANLFLRTTQIHLTTIHRIAPSNITKYTGPSQTDEQHIDISLALEAPTMQHMESAKLPKPSYNQPLVTACRHSHCVTCRYHLLLIPTFHSTHPRNRTIYRIRHTLSCKSCNLITCSKCNKQYVGCTTQQLNIRINHHRTNIFNRIRTLIATHFNLPGHILNQHLKVQAIDAVTQEDNIIRELYRLECYWIKTLHTLIPHGLNNTPGNTQYNNLINLTNKQSYLYATPQVGWGLPTEVGASPLPLWVFLFTHTHTHTHTQSALKAYRHTHRQNLSSKHDIIKIT